MQIESKQQILEQREVGGISPTEKLLEHHNKTKK